MKPPPPRRNASGSLPRLFERAVENHQRGRLTEAERLYNAILATRPNHFEVLYWFGMLLYRQGRHGEALARLAAAVKAKPGEATAWSSLGVVQAALRRHEAALVSYDKALALAPGCAEAHNNRGAALVALDRLEEALASYDNALALQPDHALALDSRATLLMRFDRGGEALASYDKALACRADFVEARGNKAIALAELGRWDAAIASIERAIAIAPRRARSYYDLTLLKPMTAGDPCQRAMRELALDMASLSAIEQIDLNFALGRSCHQVGDHERAFRHWRSGNAVKRAQIVYGEAATLNALQQTAQIFSSQRLRGAEGAGDLSPVPVFIVGFARSGTTLVEQILASHAKVHGAGEIHDFHRAVEAVVGVDRASRFPDGLAELSAEQPREIGAAYLDRVRRAAPARAERVVNKMLENFRFLGLVHMALPNARILHVRRDAIDACLSCFTHKFVGDLPYAYDLAELGRYYRAYEALMAHWRAALPPDAMLEVRYEDVVADLEREARRIVAHCRLDWDANCLAFHKTERTVRTASAVEVRRPIHANAVGGWRAYARFLGPLLRELAPDATAPARAA